MPSRALPAVLFALACALTGACATSSTAFGPTEYEQTAFHYRIAYPPKAGQQVLGGDWRLDNLIWDQNAGFVAKAGPEYRFFRETDQDGDGKISVEEQHEEAIHDLRFVNARDGGVIWSKAHPLLFKDAAQDLDIALENYAQDLSGEGYYAAGNIFSAEIVKARKYVSFIVERGPIQIGPNLGVVATIELAETEQLRLDPNHRSSRLKVVFTKLAYQNPLDSKAVPGMPKRGIKCGSDHCEQGIALLVLGYYNEAAHFAEHVGEFDGLVKRVALSPEALLPERYRSRPVKAVAATASAPAPAASAASPTPPPATP
jgi:hypothetical protein